MTKPVSALAAAKLCLAGLALFCTMAFGYFYGIRTTGNFNTVVAGEVYRSAQLSPEQLERFTAENGIKSIINLRDDGPGSDWYADEVASAGRLHVSVFDFPMSAQAELTLAQSQALIDLMRDAPKPVLIHCKAGADRTGLAASLYLAAIKGVDPEIADDQLALRFGHVSLPFWPEYAMDRSFTAATPLFQAHRAP